MAQFKTSQSAEQLTLFKLAVSQAVCGSQLFLDVEGDLGVEGEAGASVDGSLVPGLGQQTAWRLKLPSCGAQGGFEEGSEMFDDADGVNRSKRRGGGAVGAGARRLGGGHRFHGGGGGGDDDGSRDGCRYRGSLDIISGGVGIQVGLAVGSRGWSFVLKGYYYGHDQTAKGCEKGEVVKMGYLFENCCAVPRGSKVASEDGEQEKAVQGADAMEKSSVTELRVSSGPFPKVDGDATDEPLSRSGARALWLEPDRQFIGWMGSIADNNPNPAIQEPGSSSCRLLLCMTKDMGCHEGRIKDQKKMQLFDSPFFLPFLEGKEDGLELVCSHRPRPAIPCPHFPSLASDKISDCLGSTSPEP